MTRGATAAVRAGRVVGVVPDGPRDIMPFHPSHRRVSRRSGVAAVAVLLLLLAVLYVWAFARGRDRTPLRDIAPQRDLSSSAS